VRLIIIIIIVIIMDPLSHVLFIVQTGRF